MNKKIKIILGIVGLLAITVSAYIAYTTFTGLRSYQYSTAKGQKYTLKYFKDSQIVDSEQIAIKMDSTEIQAGIPTLLSYPEDDLGIGLYITDMVNKPLTKTCAGGDSFAFTVDDYEVCKLVDKNNTVVLFTRIGDDNKYFMVFIIAVVDGKRVTVSKDKAYGQKVLNFDLMNYEDQIKTILKSVRPTN